MDVYRWWQDGLLRPLDDVGQWRKQPASDDGLLSLVDDGTQHLTTTTAFSLWVGSLLANVERFLTTSIFFFSVSPALSLSAFDLPGIGAKQTRANTTSSPSRSTDQAIYSTLTK